MNVSKMSLMFMFIIVFNLSSTWAADIICMGGHRNGLDWRQPFSIIINNEENKMLLKLKESKITYAYTLVKENNSAWTGGKNLTYLVLKTKETIKYTDFYNYKAPFLELQINKNDLEKTGVTYSAYLKDYDELARMYHLKNQPEKLGVFNLIGSVRCRNIQDVKTLLPEIDWEYANPFYITAIILDKLYDFVAD